MHPLVRVEEGEKEAEARAEREEFGHRSISNVDVVEKKQKRNFLFPGMA